MVTVSYGAAGGDLEGLEGLTVGAIRQTFADAFRIPNASEAPAQINGQSVNEDARVSAGDELDFVKATAQKG